MSRAAPSALDAVIQPLRSELLSLQARVQTLEQELHETRTAAAAASRAAERRVAALLDAAAGSREPPCVLPPPSHPFWKEEGAAASVVRTLADSEAARQRAEAQLEAALEPRKSLTRQLREAHEELQLARARASIR
jgi:hypothetical protein